MSKAPKKLRSGEKKSAHRSHESLRTGRKGSASPLSGETVSDTLQPEEWESKSAPSISAQPSFTQEPQAEDANLEEPPKSQMSPTESPKSEDDVAHGSSTQLLRTPVTPKDTGSPATSFGGSIPLPKEEAKRPGESSPSSGGASPLSTTFPMMSEKEFLSRLGNVNLSATKFHYNAEPVKEPIRVLVTAATSELSYLMLIPIARGDVFGLDQPIFLHIYDEGENISDLQGIAMELEDCSFSLLKQVLPTSEDEVAFLNIDVAFLNDGAPTDGDKNLYEQCVQTYVGHGKAFENYAKKTVKVVVSGHPIQTNTFICTK